MFGEEKVDPALYALFGGGGLSTSKSNTASLDSLAV
jgi:hypothetical protein